MFSSDRYCNIGSFLTDHLFNRSYNKLAQISDKDDNTLYARSFCGDPQKTYEDQNDTWIDVDIWCFRQKQISKDNCKNRLQQQ